jgi:hypothetical protein
MRHGIGVNCINAGSKDADVRLVCASERRDDAVKDFTVDFVLGAWRKGNINVIAVAGTFAKFVFKAGVPREERPGRLMEGDVEYAGLVIEGKLDAIPMMGIDIEVKNAAVLLEEILDGDDDIIQVTESGGVIGTAMVEAAGRTEDEAHVLL